MRRKKNANSTSLSTLARRQKRLRNLIAYLEKVEATDDDPKLRKHQQELAFLKDDFSSVPKQAEELIREINTEYLNAIDRIISPDGVDQLIQESESDTKTWLPFPSQTAPYIRHETRSLYLRHILAKVPRTSDYDRISELFHLYIEEVIYVRREEKSAMDDIERRYRVTKKRIKSHRTPAELPRLKGLLKDCVSELGKIGKDEETLKKLFRVDETTIAQAAAHTKTSRRLARSLRPRLDEQFKKSKRCPYCYETISGTPIADHIFPVSMGGLSIVQNLVYVCESCNSAKSDMTLREFCVKFSLDREGIENNLLWLGKRV